MATLMGPTTTLMERAVCWLPVRRLCNNVFGCLVHSVCAFCVWLCAVSSPLQLQHSDPDLADYVVIEHAAASESEAVAAQ